MWILFFRYSFLVIPMAGKISRIEFVGTDCSRNIAPTLPLSLKTRTIRFLCDKPLEKGEERGWFGGRHDNRAREMGLDDGDEPRQILSSPYVPSVRILYNVYISRYFCGGAARARNFIKFSRRRASRRVTVLVIRSAPKWIIVSSPREINFRIFIAAEGTDWTRAFFTLH